MQLPTIKLRHKATGRVKIVNQTKYSDNLAAWDGWSIVSMRGGTASDNLVAMERNQERIEEARKRNPKSPAFGDAQRAFEARSGAEIITDPEFTQNTSSVAPEPEVAVTTNISEPTPIIETVVERDIPVIGGVKRVKVRSRKSTGEGDVF